MMGWRRIWQAVGTPIVALALLITFGCSDDPEPIMAPVDNTGKLVPDFSLLDVNSTSATHDEQVSPRDYLQKVSGWYFGAAT